MNWFSSFAFASLAFLMLFGCKTTYIPASFGWKENMTEAELDSATQSIISKMTLREKIYEMHGHGVLRMGVRMLFGGSIRPVGAGGSKKHKIPETVFLDGPRGVSLYKSATAFPVTMARGASWDVELERRVGEAMAKEIRCLGANYSGAVCMNLLRHPAWGRAQETYGEDSWHVGEMAASLVSGIQQHHVQACVKHFAANSMENNRFGGSMNMSERTLREVYLPHFKRAIDEGAASVMSAYNKLNGEYCGHHKKLLTEILRDEWGFKGYVTSDWMDGLFDTQKGIEAGMNVEMPAAKFYTYNKVKKLLRDGKITAKQIDKLIFPTIRTKISFASRKDLIDYPKSILNNSEHITLAREVAEKSAVLLKNDGNLLPLDRTSLKKIAVIGSLADVEETGDHGSSWVKPNYVVTPLKGIKNFLGDDVQILTADTKNLEQIKSVARQADVVIVVAGTTYKDEGEYMGNGKIRNRENPDKGNFITKVGALGLGGDRKYLHLHQPDIDIILAATSVNKNVVVSLVAGSAITVEQWYEHVPSIIQTFYNGMEGGNALANLLFGEVNPSGKLPFTVPVNESDLPPFDSFASEVEYGYYHGYSLFDKSKKSVRFPFGFGLSYTTFEFSDLEINNRKLKPDSELEINVTVKNRGQRSGAEVVQLYIGFYHSQIDRPVKLLRGFQKIYLDAGEEKRVTFHIKPEDLSYYDTETKAWKVENMMYEVLVGSSSRESDLRGREFLTEGF